MIQYVSNQSWRINPTKNQCSETQVMFLATMWADAQRTIHGPDKENLMTLRTPANKKGARHLIDLLSLRYIIPHITTLLSPLHYEPYYLFIQK